jgi:hypothetical protein
VNDTNWGEFYDPVNVLWEHNGSRDMLLVREVRYEDKRGLVWTAPKNSRINGASVPWFFRRVFPAYIGKYRRASVIHDVYCESKLYSSWKVHRMFYEAMRCDGTHCVTTWLMWAAVRIFGPRFKGREG